MKDRRRIENRDTITNLMGGDATTITKRQRLEIVETYRPPKDIKEDLGKRENKYLRVEVAWII